MHIADGVLTAPVLIGGAVASAGGIGLGLRTLHADAVPRAGLMTALLFVVSLVHVPAGPGVSVHLVMNSLAGLLLGWTAFPVIFVALFLQAQLFNYGGITVLGVNTLNMALPAVVCCLVWRPVIRMCGERMVFFAGFAAAAMCTVLSALGIGLSLLASGGEFAAAVKIILLAHVPVMVIEGIAVGSATVLLKRVRPELFHQSLTAGTGFTENTTTR